LLHKPDSDCKVEAYLCCHHQNLQSHWKSSYKLSLKWCNLL